MEKRSRSECSRKKSGRAGVLKIGSRNKGKAEGAYFVERREVVVFENCVEVQEGGHEIDEMEEHSFWN